MEVRAKENSGVAGARSCKKPDATLMRRAHTGELKHPAPTELVFPDSEPSPGMFLRHISVLKMGVQFPEEGPYSFEVHIDGTYHAAVNLYVKVVEQAS